MKKNWNRTELKHWFVSELQDALDLSELNDIFFRILESFGISKLEWATMNEIEINQVQWNSFVTDLKKDCPIQYILGYEYFAGEKFMVNEHVLIPRPETEELVQWILSENEQLDVRILDIGTGSGCIPISLKKKIPTAKITATDISPEALELATKNSQNLNVIINFVKDDILRTKLVKGEFDIIVSNPPYIPQEEANSIAKRVKDYEPHLALFTIEKHPLQFYEAIMLFAKENLRPNGKLYFEVHEDFANQVSTKSKHFGFVATLKKDIYGKSRMARLKFDL